MKNNFITKIIGATLAFAMMIGGAVGINAAKQATEVDAANSGINASDGTFVIDFYDNSKLSSTSGSNLTAQNYTNFVKVATGLTANSVVTGVTVSGTVQYGKNGGLTVGSSSNNSNSVSFTIGSDYAVTKCTVYASYYEEGRWKLGGNVADNQATAVYSAKAGAITTKPLLWENLDNLTTLAFTKDNGSGGNQKRLTIHTIVCEYSTSNAPVITMPTKPAYIVDGGDAGSLVAEIANNDNYTITWSASPSAGVTFTPYTSSSGENVSVAFDGATTGTTPVTVVATLNDSEHTSASTKIYGLEHAGTLEDPFSATDAQVFSHKNYAAQSGGDWYVQGYVVSVYQNKGYYIDEDATNSASKKFEVYNASGVVNNTGRDIIVGTSYIVAHGAMTCYNENQSEITGSVIVSVDNGAIPNIVIDGGDRTVEKNESITLTATVENADDAVVSWSSNAPEVATINPSSGAVTLVAPGTADITATITVEEHNYSSTITLTVYENILENGDTFVIKANYQEQTYYLTGVNDSNLGTVSTNKSNAMVFTAVESETAGQFRFKNGSNYLSYSGSNNNVYTVTDNTENDTLWTAIDNGDAEIIKSVNVNNRRLQFNYNSGNNPRFACYSSEQIAIMVEKVVAPEVDEVIVVGNDFADANDALSISQEFDFEVTYVDQNNLGSGLVTAVVKNSNDAEEGARIDEIDQANGVITVTFTANDTFTVKVISLEDEEKFATATIAISGIHVPVLIDYNLYDNNTLVDGDYILTYDDAAIKAEISNDRAVFLEVTPNENKISTEASNIVWHISRYGEYYTIYNALEGKYLASTNSKNTAKLESDITDNSCWTVEYKGGQFDFVNKARPNGTDPNNKYLRKNGNIGYGCYASSTGGALTLYKRDAMSYLDSFNTEAKLVATETDGNIDSASIKFTTKIAKYAWDAIVSDYGISEFGMMGYRTRKASPLTVEEKYDAEQDKNNLSTLLVINTDTYGLELDEEDGYYSFTVKVNISGPSSYDLKFIMAPYIVVNGTYHFLDNLDPSVNYLAQHGLVESQLSQEALAALSGGQGE